MNRKPFAKPMLFGHRGSVVDHPENTLAGFAACLKNRIDGIELDVQRCKTGELVVIHDYDLKRVAGNPQKVKDLDYAQLKEFDVGQGQHIPLLEEVFALCKRDCFYDIELKSEGIQSDGLEQALFQAILKAGLSDRVFVSSFNPVSLLRFRTISRHSIPTALIYADEPSLPRILRHGFGRFLAKPDYLKPQHALAEEALRLPYQICPWTVDDPMQAKRLLAQGVMGMVSNNPLLLTYLFND